MTTRARVLLADDHPLVRNALANLLKGHPEVEVVGQVGSFPELWQALDDTVPEVVVLDVKMPGGNGLDAVHELRRRHPDVNVLVLSGFPETELAARMIQEGASGYVQKDEAPDVLREAIVRVARGGVYLSTAGAAALARAAGPAGAVPDHQKLSTRELQVLRLLGEGRSVSEIGDELKLSVKTVSTYRTRLMEKMGLTSTADIIRYAIRAGLVE